MSQPLFELICFRLNYLRVGWISVLFFFFFVFLLAEWQYGRIPKISFVGWLNVMKPDVVVVAVVVMVVWLLF